MTLPFFSFRNILSSLQIVIEIRTFRGFVEGVPLGRTVSTRGVLVHSFYFSDSPTLLKDRYYVSRVPREDVDHIQSHVHSKVDHQKFLHFLESWFSPTFYQMFGLLQRIRHHSFLHKSFLTTNGFFIYVHKTKVIGISTISSSNLNKPDVNKIFGFSVTIYLSNYLSILHNKNFNFIISNIIELQSILTHIVPYSIHQYKDSAFTF